MIYIKIPVDEESSITIYKNDELLYQINRKLYFGYKIRGEFYDKENKLFAVVTKFYFYIKILFQEVPLKIKVKNNLLFYSKFIVGKNKINIYDNPLYFIYPKFYSKIYWNNRFIANVGLQKVGFENITLKIDFKTNNDREEVHYSTLVYAMTCININV